MGIRDERTEDLFLIDLTSAGNPSEEGQVRRVSGDIVAFIGGAVKSLTAGGSSGITESQHEALDTLVHDIDETSYEEYTYSQGFVTNVTVWATAAKLLKIREEQYTYNVGKIDTVTTIQYDGTGATKMTTVETCTYSGGQIASVARVKT